MLHRISLLRVIYINDYLQNRGSIPGWMRKDYYLVRIGISRSKKLLNLRMR